MSFSFSKLFNKSESNQSNEDTIEAIIAAIENKPYGVSDNNVLFAGLNELGGYFFFQTVIVGALKTKCKNGAQLFFIGENFKLQLNSDVLEFESDHSDVKGRFITKIDFQIEESDIEKLQSNKLKTIIIKVRNQEISFGKYIPSNEEE